MPMSATREVHHLVLTPDGGLREYPPDLAARVAAGDGALPEFAERRVRYLRVTVIDAADGELRVVTTGASIQFDRDGRLAAAGPIEGDPPRLSTFEHDACVEWALRNFPTAPVVLH